MSIAKEKKKWNYQYHYPEQKEIFKGLGWGDMALIARKTGFTPEYIGMMAAGSRKITPEVRLLVEKMTLLRQEMQNL
jgi:hypothetical protein